MGDIYFPSDDFRESVARYLTGDAHELDLLVARHFRNIASVDDDSASKHTAKKSQVRHFCAASLLTSIFWCESAGSGHNELPLVIALTVVRDLPDWAEPSAGFLAALLDAELERGLGETACFVKVALSCLELLPGSVPRGRHVSTEEVEEAIEWNIDWHVPRLSGELLKECERLVSEVPEHVREPLRAFARSWQ
ncbi:MAG: hypothetical protein ACFCBV_12250 [Phycisphaerales bacterium]